MKARTILITGERQWLPAVHGWWRSYGAEPVPWVRPQGVTESGTPLRV